MKTKITILILLGCTVIVLAVIVVGNFFGKDVVSDSVESIVTQTTQLATSKTYTTMTLHSSAFENNQTIPTEYTCDGKGMNPPLEFLAVPVAAKSLALIMEDPDVPTTIRMTGVWDHWLVWNMPVTTKGIASGQKVPGVVGQNTSGTFEYFAPCPPDAQHHYVFTLYALDSMLTLDAATTTKEHLRTAMEGHILEQSEFIGVYNRR